MSQQQMEAEAEATMTAGRKAGTAAARQNPPYLPTAVERLVLGLFPAVLVFGAVFSVVSPQTRSAAYDAASQAHTQDDAPGYFVRKSNVFNVVFVKRGWGWTTAAFAAFAATHPAMEGGRRRLRAGLRWAAATAWWFLVTQWCFGPAVIDRGFRWTGGRCEEARREAEAGAGGVGEKLTAAACKAVGGRWRGGHDISGHVFLLVLGTAFLAQEVGWAAARWSGQLGRDERSVVMADGAVKSAGVEAEDGGPGRGPGVWLGPGGKAAAGVAALNLWMLLMTAMYFHTWFEKFTGLLTALVGVYGVYVVPRFVPAVRRVVGLPGI